MLLSDSLQVYVAPDGSDETGTGTKEKPFATPDYAVIWSNINCEFAQYHDLVVNVAPGTYDAVQVYGHSAQQIYIIGDRSNPSAVKFRVIEEDYAYALSVSYNSHVDVYGVDIASALVTTFSHLGLYDCWLNPEQSGNNHLLAASGHSTAIFVTGLVKSGPIGEAGKAVCYDCELNSYIQVGNVDYEATVECDTFCDARFSSSIYLNENSPSKANVRTRRAARAITQSIVCDSDYLPKGSVPSLAASGGLVDNLEDSELTFD